MSLGSFNNRIQDSEKTRSEKNILKMATKFSRAFLSHFPSYRLGYTRKYNSHIWNCSLKPQ